MEDEEYQKWYLLFPEEGDPEYILISTRAIEEMKAAEAEAEKTHKEAVAEEMDMWKYARDD